MNEIKYTKTCPVRQFQSENDIVLFKNIDFPTDFNWEEVRKSGGLAINTQDRQPEITPLHAICTESQCAWWDDGAGKCVAFKWVATQDKS